MTVVTTPDAARRDAIVKRYLKAHEAWNAAASALDEYFLPRIRGLLSLPALHEQARELFRQIPSESVTKVFALDAFRQADVAVTAPSIRAEEKPIGMLAHDRVHQAQPVAQSKRKKVSAR